MEQALQDTFEHWLVPGHVSLEEDEATLPQPAWGQVPSLSQLIHVAHRAHPAIARVELETNLTTLHLQPHQLPTLGTLTLWNADTDSPLDPQSSPATPEAELSREVS